MSEVAPTVGLIPLTAPKKMFMMDGRSMTTADLVMIAQGWYKVQVNRNMTAVRSVFS